MKTLIISIGAALCAAVSALAESTTLNGRTWDYSVSGGTVTITGVSPKDGALIIPSEIGSHPVVSIGDSAFAGSAKLTNVTLPESVTKIECRAFYGCVRLAAVNFPDGVTDIGDDAFEGCASLTAALLPECLQTVGNRAFANCYALKELVLPGSVFSTYGMDNVFALDDPGRFRAWENVTVGSGVDGYAVTEIGGFSGCPNLRHVVLPSSVREISGEAFFGCARLESVTIEDDGAWADDPYDYWEGRIGGSAFEGCASLVCVDIPEGVTRIESSAFEGCAKLKDMTLPESVTMIGDRAFCACASLTSVNFPEGEVRYDGGRFYYYGGVEYIGDEAFCGCASLTGVVLPNSLTTLGANAFGDCGRLISVTFEGDAPDVGWSAFQGVGASCTAWVSKSSVGWEVPIPGMWEGIKIDFFNELLPVSCGKGLVPVQVNGVWTISSVTGYALTEGDLASVNVKAKLQNGLLVSTTKGYKVVRSADGKSATLLLKTPEVGVQPDAGETEKAADDPSGMLVEVDESELATKPEAGDGESVGALPVKAVPGLWYQASWGDGLQNMTQGEKVQATGDSLYLGVIKQTGASGFYRLSVSEK